MKNEIVNKDESSEAHRFCGFCGVAGDCSNPKCLAYEDDEVFYGFCPYCGGKLVGKTHGGVECSDKCGYWFCF